MAFLQRQQLAAMEDDVGIGDAAIVGDSGRRPGSLRPKPPNSARPASCSACHFGVRTQRLR